MKLILSNKNNLEIFEKKLYRMDFLYSFLFIRKLNSYFLNYLKNLIWKKLKIMEKTINFISEI